MPPAQTVPAAGQVAFGVPQSGSSGPMGAQQMPPAQTSGKARSAILWAAVGLVAATVMCGAGFLILGFVGLSMDSGNTSKGDRPTNSKEARSEMEFDFAKWRSETDEYAVLEVDGDSALLKTKSRQFYYVLLVGPPYVSYNRGASVTVTNMDGLQSSQGYGLVFHSSVPALSSDYAFLIDAERGEFKVVKHSNKTERQITDWKASDAIRGGSAENVLEIIDDGAKITCFINGQSVYKFNDESTEKEGTIGIYSSDAKIKFTELKTFK